MLVVECEWLVVAGGRMEEGPYWVSVEGGSITGVHRASPLLQACDQHLHTHLLTPGFIDLHTHGVGRL